MNTSAFKCSIFTHHQYLHTVKQSTIVAQCNLKCATLCIEQLNYTLTSREGARERVCCRGRTRNSGPQTVTLLPSTLHGGCSQHGTDVGGITRVETADVGQDYRYQREVELSYSCHLALQLAVEIDIMNYNLLSVVY